MDGDTYRFTAPLQRYEGPTAWFFVNLPEDTADDIDERFGHLAAGFGSLRVEVTVGATTWRTSIFPDRKHATYLLFVKQQVRRAEGLDEGSDCAVALTVVAGE